MKKQRVVFTGRVSQKRLFLFELIVVLFCITLVSAELVWADKGTAEGSASSETSKWTLEVDGKYTCVAVKANAQHTDTHRGSVSFEMPKASGKVEANNGQYQYSVSGQTFGNPYQFSTPGRFTFTGEVVPGLLRFTPQVHLPDGTPFFKPVRTYEMPIYDGATFMMPPNSNPEMKCTGPVTYTLRGAEREHYHILIDDRLLIGTGHGVFSGHSYRTGLSLQVLTEMEVVVEDNKVKKTSGSRRLGRLTPSSHPPLVWEVTPIRGKCRGEGSYPFVSELNNSQVSATLNKSSIKLSAKGGYVDGAVQWKINPKQAKRVSPEIQYGRPERFNGELCTDEALRKTVWTFPRRRNTTKTTEDTFDYMQVLTVTQETTAMGEAPGASAGQPPVVKYFKGDVLP